MRTLAHYSAAPMRMSATSHAPHLKSSHAARPLLSQKTHMRKALRLELAALPQESIKRQSTEGSIASLHVAQQTH